MVEVSSVTSAGGNAASVVDPKAYESGRFDEAGVEEQQSKRIISIFGQQQEERHRNKPPPSPLADHHKRLHQFYLTTAIRLRLTHI